MRSLTHDRGQTEILGHALILSLVVVSVFGTVALGTGTIQAALDHTKTENSQSVMTSLGNDVSNVALDDSNSESSIRFPTQMASKLTIDEGAGQMTIKTQDRIGYGGNSETILSVPLGSITYGTASESTIAYQSGGLFQRQGDGSVALSNPSISTEEQTVMVSAILLNQDSTIRGQQSFDISEGSSVGVYPNQSVGYENPVQGKEILIVIQSQYYQAWGEFFQTETTADTVLVEENKETVTATFNAGHDTYLHVNTNNVTVSD